MALNPGQVHGSCALPYSYDDNSKKGSFHGITEFFVDDNLDDVQVKERQFAYKYMHDSLLRIKFIDAIRGRIFYQIFDRTIQEHTQILALEGTPPIEYARAVMANGGVVYIRSVPCVFREMFKQFLSFVEHAHSKSYFTTGFDMGNIVIIDGKVKFYRVHFKYIQTLQNDEDNSAMRKAAKNEDYKRLHAIISAIFEQYASIPRDMRHFLNFLVAENKNKANVAKHVALLGYRESLQIPVDLDDMGIKGSKKDATLGWKKNVKDSGIRMLIHCLDFKDPERKNPSEAAYVDTKADTATSHLFRFLRNVTAHVKPQNSNARIRVNNKTIAASVMDLFGDTIAEFQEQYLYK